MSPLNASEFEAKGKAVEIKERVDRKSEVLAFLEKNAKEAYTQKEVADKLAIQQTQARSVLMNLIEEGKVRRAEVQVDGKLHIYYALV
jgi:predicted ArsR family transcriptional regulator